MNLFRVCLWVGGTVIQALHEFQQTVAKDVSPLMAKKRLVKFLLLWYRRPRNQVFLVVPTVNGELALPELAVNGRVIVHTPSLSIVQGITILHMS